MPELTAAVNQAVKGRDLASLTINHRSSLANGVLPCKAKGQAGVHTTGAKAEGETFVAAAGDEFLKLAKAGAKGVAEIGLGGARAAGGVGALALELGGKDAKVTFGDAGAAGKVGLGASGVACKGNLGVKVVEADTKHLNAHLGLKVDTGFEISNEKVSGKVLGIGGSIGTSGFSLSCPFGGFGIKW